MREFYMHATCTCHGIPMAVSCTDAILLQCTSPTCASRHRVWMMTVKLSCSSACSHHLCRRSLRDAALNAPKQSCISEVFSKKPKAEWRCGEGDRMMMTDPHLAQIGCECDDLALVGVLQPFEDDRCVQPARVRQNYLLDLDSTHR